MLLMYQGNLTIFAKCCLLGLLLCSISDLCCQTERTQAFASRCAGTKHLFCSSQEPGFPGSSHPWYTLSQSQWEPNIVYLLPQAAPFVAAGHKPPDTSSDVWHQSSAGTPGLVAPAQCFVEQSSPPTSVSVPGQSKEKVMWLSPHCPSDVPD